MEDEAVVAEDGAEQIAVHQLSPTEAVVFGPLGVIDQMGTKTSELPQSLIESAQRLAATAPQLTDASGAISGRVVKLTRESAAALREHGPSKGPGGSIYGVVRSADGKVTKHLSFTRPGAIASAAIAIPALAGAAALMLQQAEMAKRLDEIAEQLDYIVANLHNETLAELSASLLSLEDVYRATERNGDLDDDHWQVVANLHPEVRRLHDLTWRHLDPLREVLANPDGNLSERVRRLNTALRGNHAVFWLQAHVHAELALLRWQSLYVMRQAQTHPETINEVVEEFQAAAVDRHQNLVELANGLARYVNDNGKITRLLDKIRLIRRTRLNALLGELEGILGVYRQSLKTITGHAPPELSSGQEAIALGPGDVESDRDWRDLIDHLGRVPELAGKLTATAARVRPAAAAARNRFADRVGRTASGTDPVTDQADDAS